MGKNLTTGSVFRTIVTFALPYLLSYFLQTLYGMADLFIAGQCIGIDGKGRVKMSVRAALRDAKAAGAEAAGITE